MKPGRLVFLSLIFREIPSIKAKLIYGCYSPFGLLAFIAYYIKLVHNTGCHLP